MAMLLKDADRPKKNDGPNALAREIAGLLERSTLDCLEPNAAIAFSGGLDSSILAAVASRQPERKIQLVCVGTPDCDDLPAARAVARELKMELHETILEPPALEILAREFSVLWPEEKEKAMAQEKTRPRESGPAPGRKKTRAQECALAPGQKNHASLSPINYRMKRELGIAWLAVCHAARKLGARVILSGAGAEELFAGYDRHYEIFERDGADALEKKLARELGELPQTDLIRNQTLARACGLEVRTPFLDERLAAVLSRVPAGKKIGDRRRKKPLLREAARLLGVPERAVERPKKALQYGSGVQKAMRHRPGTPS